MVTPGSRRSFLFGRRAPPTEWGTFCSRLARTCQGAVRWSDDAAKPQAWLKPQRVGDIEHAFALCREYGITMQLAGVDESPSVKTVLPRLTLDPGTAWASCVVQDMAGQKLWRADAGCKLSAVQSLGFNGFEDAPPDWTVARWLASPLASRWAIGRSDRSVISSVEVRLSDGTIEELGSFGTSARTPLKSMRVQQMVPKLFELATGEQAGLCAQQPVWPARTRLDALMSLDGQEPNLALLLAGHAGSLAWVQSVWFKSIDSQHSGNDLPVVDPEEFAARSTDVRLAAQWLDEEVKKTFDPIGLFGAI